MSTCIELREALLDWADGRGTPERRDAVEVHLATCARCRGLAESLGALQPLESLARVETPPAMLAEVHAQLNQRLDELEPRPRPGWLTWLFSGSIAIPKPFAWAAVAAVLLLWAGHVTGPAPAPRAAPSTPVLMDGVDRLGASESSAEG